MLRDRSPLGIATSLDLHFLGTSQAFVLSQDQTLHQKTDVNSFSKERNKPLVNNSSHKIQHSLHIRYGTLDWLIAEPAQNV